MPKIEKASEMTNVAEIVVPPVQQYVAPPKHIERQGGSTQPRVRRYPEVRAGVCEYHGTVNPHVPGEKQYLYCPDTYYPNGQLVHPRWGELQCSYCEDYKDPHDTMKKSIVQIYDSPTDPNALIVVCDNFSCVAAHRKRFMVSQS